MRVRGEVTVSFEGVVRRISDTGTVQVLVKDANGDDFVAIVPIEFVKPVDRHPVV